MRYAHSGLRADRSDWQTLPDHLSDSAERARLVGADIGIPLTAQLATRLHDLGKYDPDFEKRLQGQDIRIDHSTAGGWALVDRAALGAEKLVASLLAYAILGHHAGLPDLRGTSGSLEDRINSFVTAHRHDRLDPAWQADAPIDFAGVVDEVVRKVRAGDGTDMSLLVRMTFSCLIDADRRDTERFYDALTGRARDRDWPSLPDILPRLRAAYDAHMGAFAADTPVRALRRDILTAVRAKAAMPPGLFTLTVPTGGGKTLATLGFALDHAFLHGHRRIIYAIPFTSIIDQTVAVFETVLGKGIILPHHASLETDKPDREGRDEDGAVAGTPDRMRLAMEDWAAPIVVTTNVQFFESLFAARPSRARKLHNIAGSVIILDEAQALPRPFLLPCVRMLDSLAAHWGCTIILCTATQPALGTEGLNDKGLPLAGRELAPDPTALAARLGRTRIGFAGAMDDAALVAALGATPQGLVIVNSRAHALALHRAGGAAGLDGLVHLTTRRCAADRRPEIDRIKACLASGEACRVIATSLIEAGVDVDFPQVWRANAGLDAVLQAAGRCNREGRRDPAQSLVTVFDAPDHPPPREVAGLVEATSRILSEHIDDLSSPAAIEAYFCEVYWSKSQFEPGRNGSLDARNVLGRLHVDVPPDFAFRSIAQDVRFIDDEAAPVIVPYDDWAKDVIAKLGVEAIRSSKLARDLQPYVVGIPPEARARLLANGRVAFAAPHLRADQFAVLTDPTLYREGIGLVWEDADVLPTSSSII